MKGARSLIVAGGIALAVILGLSAALAMSVQSRRQMAHDHGVEIGDMHRARVEQESDLERLRGELRSAQAKIVALQSTLEEIRSQLAALSPDVSSRSAPSPMAPLFLRRTPTPPDDRPPTD